MSNTETVVGITEELQPCPSTEVVYAWGEAEDEPETDDLPSTVSYRPMIAVTALAAVALATVGVAAVVSLMSPAPQPSRYSIRPPVVEQAPAPLKAAPAPAPKAAPAPVVVQPPVAVQPPPVALQPNANQRFSASLAQGKMWQQPDANDDQQARSMCADLAAGGSVQPYITGTEKKSPQLLPQEAAQAVHDAIESYCPQYDR